ncbi:MAG TPA: GlmU family protein [Bacteroidales bacterium]|nr:GlmU family protein [Bacteroidales bacterium]
MNIILFDDSAKQTLLPLTYTRPVCEIRCGILTIKEKWEKYLNASCSFFTNEILSSKFKTEITEDNILINGSVLPSATLTENILSLRSGEILKQHDLLLAARLNNDQVQSFRPETMISQPKQEFGGTILRITNPWDIFSLNGIALEEDFKLLTKGRESATLSSTNNIIAPENIFAEEGAKAEYATLNASTGPIYLGKESEVMEGSNIRGAFALCEHAATKMGAKVYGPTTIGPHSKVGGEVHNSVLFGFSNKAHDGFLGNSVLGEWCNLGADTNTSNLKNNYASVRLWNYQSGNYADTGLQFCGLIMGDHSKCGINTMFNTGTIVGVFANIFGAGFPRNFIPSFSWGGASGFSTYALSKAFEVAEIVMARRNVEFTESDRQILMAIFDKTMPYRKS